jgi:hypothetical protein
MASQTVRIRSDTHERLRELAAERQESLQDVLADAVERLWRDDLLEQTNAAFAALREDEGAWADELAERAAWDAASVWPDDE